MAVSETERPASPLLIRLFGAFEAWRDGEPLPPLRTRKGQWLLALLTLYHGREVERNWLAGTLWPESPQHQALYNLRRSLSDLRGALGGQAFRLHTATPRVLSLDLTGAEVDVVLFDTGIAQGNETGLERAVGLCRGPLLEGCLEEWAVPERERRAQSYFTALETLAAGARARGDHAVGVRFLKSAVAAEPLRETAQRALMEALSDSGDTAAAMLVYREFRLLLHRELNAEPSPETRALFARLRDAARRRASGGVQERESERAREQKKEGWTTLSDPSLRGNRPHASGAPVSLPRSLAPALPRAGVPRPLSPFVGREREVREVAARLARARIVTLTGTGGIGKTRLALRLAEETADVYADGVCYVDLSALADPTLVPQAVARAVGVAEETERPLTRSLQSVLGSRGLLMVLDNCEHLLDACAQLAVALLAHCPGLRILATSRQALGPTEEIVWRVPSLSLPEPAAEGPLQREPERLMDFEAIRLFVSRASLASSFTLEASNAAATVRVCRRLDGIPLAIELAAARLRVLSIEQIAARLDDRFRLLTGGSRTALPRQQTLRATLDWGYDLASEAERLLLRRLSVFNGGWTLEAAEVVCADPVDGCQLSVASHAPSPSALTTDNCQLSTDSVVGLLSALVEKSLVIYAEEEGRGRYTLLETVRQYARDRLLEAGEAAVVRTRHREWVLDLAERAEAHEADWRLWRDRLRREDDNLRAALEGNLAGTMEPEEGLRLAGALWPFWSQRVTVSEGEVWLESFQRWLRSGLADPAAPPTAARAKVLRGAGHLASRRGEFAAARALFQESLENFQSLGDRAGTAGTLNAMGYLAATSECDYDTARACYEQSLAIQRERGDEYEIALLLNNLGDVARVQAEYVAARAYYEEGLAIQRRTGTRSSAATLLDQIGNVAWLQGDFATARALHEEGLAIRRELGDSPAISLFYLGEVARCEGALAAARAFYEEGLALLRQRGDRGVGANSLRGLGNIAFREGDFVAARAYYRESVAIGADRRNTWSVVNGLESMAELETALGIHERAARLWGAAEARREVIGTPLPPIVGEEYRQHLAAARAAIGETAFKAAWSAGRAMTLAEAVRLALAG